MEQDIIKTRIKKDDTVIVKTGADSGKRGKVLSIDKKKGRIIVEGINKRNKFFKKTQEHPKGGVQNKEFPINISNVMLFCEKCKKGVRIGIEMKNDEKTRVCRKCGKSLDK